jgi:thioesterase domain-containing protein/acyl carrier protein
MVPGVSPVKEIEPAGGYAPPDLRFGLTSPQLAIWLDQALHPRKPIYNTGQTVAIRARLNVEYFSEAIRRVVAETDALRLRFSQRHGEPLQEIVPAFDYVAEFKDFSRLDQPERAARDWIETFFWTPFTPNDFPLFGFVLIRISETHYVWVQKYHHLLVDANARHLVAARVAALYGNISGAERLPDLDVPAFAGAKSVEDEYLSSEQYKEDAAYWSERFRHPPKPLVQADPALSDKHKSGRATRIICELSDNDSVALRQFARQLHSSVFKIIVVLAWSGFSRVYETDDIVFGVPLANRANEAAKRTVGLFTKVMPFRLCLEHSISLASALIELDELLSKDLKHQRFPTEHINRLLGLRRLNRAGLYDLGINYVRNDYTFDFAGVPVSCENLSSGFILPCTIMALEYGPDSPIRIMIDYDQGRIPADQAQQFSRAFMSLLSRVPAAGHLPLAELAAGFPASRPPAHLSSPRQAVIKPGKASSSVPEQTSPHDDVEVALLEIWGERFDAAKVTLDDDFFELGGDSLAAVLLVCLVNERLGIDLPISLLFEHRTIRAMAEAIRENRSGGSRLQCLNAGSEGIPLVLVHPAGGTLFCYRDLVARLPEHRPVYGIEAAGLRPGEQLPSSVEEMAETYLAAASGSLGKSPMHLAGWSFGGLVAFEMARQLVEQGQAPASLTLIDTPATPVTQDANEDAAVLAAVAGTLGIDPAEFIARAGRALPDAIGNAAAQLGVAALSAAQIEQITALARNVRRLRKDYRLRPLAVPMTLIRATAGRLSDGNAFDWSHAMDRPVPVIYLSATHDTVLHPPHVDQVAEFFRGVVKG